MYAIMRMAKIKSNTAVAGCLRHNTREKPPRNADPEKTPDNFNPRTYDELMADYESRLPEKVRKNAVHLVEVVLTASPEFFEKLPIDKRNAYFMDCKKWSDSIFGEKNGLSFNVHLDEKTPHVQATYMPLKDGKLNAKHFIGGHRDRMKELQTDFYNKVGKKYGLERGIERETVRHTDLREYPKVLEKKEQELLAKEAQLIATQKDLDEQKKQFEKWRTEAEKALLNRQDKLLAREELLKKEISKLDGGEKIVKWLWANSLNSQNSPPQKKQEKDRGHGR